MSRTDLTTLKRRIAERYDADYIVDVLRLSSEELLDAFEDKLFLSEEFSELEDEDEVR